VTNQTNPVTPGQIKQLAAGLHSRQVQWRRHLHENPELSFEEHKTTKFLKGELEKLGLKIVPVNMETGVLAELHGKKKGPIVAIRSDIDALPIVEQSGVPFASKTHGCMHACGHDVHMATVLGCASLLAQIRDQFSGAVRFIFQPAEEMPPGGARPMIANGALSDVSMIFGLHVEPHLATGKIGLRDGASMASVYDFELIIRGRSGHAARPHLAIDAISTAAEVIESLQKVVSREIDPVDPVVLTFGKIEGGTASNVIAEEVRLAGTARTLSLRTFNKVPKLIRKTVAGVCKARGAAFEITPIADYPVLKNDPRINRMLTDTFTELFGRGRISEIEPVLGGEDFACYLEKVPGAMFRLGTMNKKIKADQPWHSPKFIVDEDAIPFGTALLAMAALKALEEK
jgi:amidohydrolase